MPRNPRADQIGMGGRMLSVQVGGSSRNAQGRVANPKMISYPPTMLHFTSEFTGDPDDIIAARNRGFQMLDSIH